MEFTQGNYEVAYDGVSKFITCNGADIAEVFEQSNPDTAHHNAKLFAAAPELLKALNRLIAVDEAHSELHAPDGDDVARMIEYAEAHEYARQVVAKATGA